MRIRYFCLTFWLVFFSLAILGAGCARKKSAEKLIQEADKLFASGNYAAAEPIYLKTLQINPTNPYPFRQLGEIYFENGRLARAFPFLVRSYQINTNDVETMLRLGQFFRAASKPADAYRMSQKVLSARPGDPVAPLLMADTAVTLGDLDNTRNFLKGLLVTQPVKAPILTALGAIDYRLRDLRSAEKQYLEALKVDPDFGDAHGKLGELYASITNHARADEEFMQSLKTAPFRSQRRLRYSQYRLSRGDTAGCKNVLNQTISTTPDYIPAMMALAEISTGEGDYKKADELLNRVFAEDSDNFDGLFLSGRLGIMTGDYIRAVDSFSRMAKLYPKTPNILYQLGLAYLAANNTQAAIGALKQAINYNPSFPEAQVLLAQLQISNDDIPTAVESLKQLLLQNPRFLRARLLLGDAYRTVGKFREAEEAYTLARDMYPTNAEPVLLMGIIHKMAGQKEVAKQELNKALDLSPGLVSAAEQLTDYDIEDKAFDVAMKRAAKIQALDTNAPQPSLLMAKIFMAQASPTNLNDPFFKKAVATLEETIRVHTNYLATYMVLSGLYSDAGFTKKSVDILKEAIQMHPQEQNGWILMGTILEKAKDTPGAEDAYEHLLKLNPDSLIGLNNLGWLSSERGQLDKAMDLLRHAHSLFPNDPSIDDSLGWVLWKRGDFARAQPLLNDAASVIRFSPEVQLHAGLVNYMMADESRAMEGLSNALKSAQNFEKKDLGSNFLAILSVKPDSTNKADFQLVQNRLEKMPDDQIALDRLAGMDQHSGNLEKATEDYEQLLRLNPKNPKALRFLVHRYLNQPGQDDRTYSLAKDFFKVEPYDVDINLILARLAFQHGDNQYSLNLLESSLSQRPNDPEILYDLAWAYYSTGNEQKAVSTMQGILTSGSSASKKDKANLFIEMLALSQKPGDAEAASGRIGEILKQEPDNISALIASAQSSLAKSDPAGAKKSLFKVLQKYPSFYPVQKQLAIITAENDATGDEKLIFDSASKALEIHPTDAVLDRALGILAGRLGDYARAVRSLKDVVLTNPKDGIGAFYLGMAQYHLKAGKEAKTSLNQAVQSKLPSKLEDQAKQMLADLK